MSGLIANAELERVASPSLDAMDANAYWAWKHIMNTQTPAIKDMQVKLAGLVQQGVLSPEDAQTFLQEATAFGDIDPKVRDALNEIVDTRGLDPQARAALQAVREEVGTQERGSREAILQNAAARGVSGSGLEMAANLANQQGGATNMANMGFQAAAEQDQRRLQALAGIQQMDAQKASAQDAINQFNAANRQAVEMSNVGTRNQAQAQNLSEAQRIADTNAAIKNQQELYNKALVQQDWDNRFSKAQAASNANLGSAGVHGGILHERNVGPTGMSNKWSDENLKTDISEVDPEEMLNNLTGYKYKYTDPVYGEGDQVGIMAQDLEKSAPQAVTDTPEGKQIDYSKMGGPMLAALASLNKRVNELEGA